MEITVVNWKACRSWINQFNHYVPSTGNAVVKIGLLKLHRPSTGIAVVETGIIFLYRLSSSFVVVKTGLQNIYKPSTSSAEVPQFHLTTTKPVECL